MGYLKTKLKIHVRKRKQIDYPASIIDYIKMEMVSTLLTHTRPFLLGYILLKTLGNLLRIKPLIF